MMTSVAAFYEAALRTNKKLRHRFNERSAPLVNLLLLRSLAMVVPPGFYECPCTYATTVLVHSKPVQFYLYC